jgi:hypothetical protein
MMTIDHDCRIGFAGASSGRMRTKYLAALFLLVAGGTAGCGAAVGETEPEPSEGAADPSHASADFAENTEELAELSAPADEVLNWNEIAQVTTLPTAPPMGSRNLAITQVSVFDAVNSIVRRYSPYAVKLRAPKGASPVAAAVAAAHYALVHLYPASQASLDTSFATSLAAIPDGQSETDGVAVGESVAEQILALRATDGSDRVVPYTPGSGPGAWIPTPPAFAPPVAPGWAAVTPFLLDRGDQFRLGPPPDLTSAEYTRGFEEVTSLGSSVATRTQEQIDIPKFWAVSGTQGWNLIARELLAAKGIRLAKSARILALLNMAGADAVIACWDTKYGYNFWRPVTAIRAADTDGNPATDADAAWSPFVVTPPFPDYVSGHATYAGASRQVLKKFFGDKVNVTLTSPVLPGVTRSYSSLRQIADEIDNARVWGGIHFRFSQDLGRKLGEDVGRFVVNSYFARAQKEVSTF